MPNKRSLLKFLLCLIVILYNINSETIHFNNSILNSKSGQNAIISIKNLSAYVSEITIDIASMEIMSDPTGTTEFSSIQIDGFSSLMTEGSPSVPVKNIQMGLLSGNEVKFEILEQENVIKEKYIINPGPKVRFMNDKSPFEKPLINKVVYSKNEFFPSSPALQVETQYYRGLPIALLQICPVQYNPVTNQLQIYSHLKIRMSTSGSLKKSYTGNMFNNKMIHNIGINGNLVADEISKIHVLHKKSTIEKIDIIIVTVDSLKPVAEEIALWHKRKGYSVYIESRTSWTSNTDVKKAISDYYNAHQTDYLLIIGDHEHVPGNPFAGNTNLAYTDLDYVCFDGSGDYIPDMAKGRISVGSLPEAKMVIYKIINYEENPPKNSDFYKKYSVYTLYEEHPLFPKQEASRKLKTAEETGNYLESKGIQFQRIYSCKNDLLPERFNSETYSFGEPIPDYLRKPGFPWDGDNEKFFNKINNGSFLFLLMRHGGEQYITDPFLYGSDTNIANGELLPFIISNCCDVGTFAYERGKCFTEQILCRKDGVVGIIGASNPNNWGYGDALDIGIINAIWPSSNLKMTSTNTPDPIVTKNTVPVYTFGDLLNIGLLHQRETFQIDDKGRNQTQYQHQIYHLFGDPTTQLWTDIPKILKINHLRYCNTNDKKLYFENPSTASGILSLISKKNGTLIRGEFTNPTLSLPVEGRLLENDTLLLTVTAHNFKPYLSEIFVVNQTTTFTITEPAPGSLVPAKSKPAIRYSCNGDLILDTLNFSYSFDRGASWVSIAKNQYSPGATIRLSVPDTTIDSCLIRIRSIKDTNIQCFSGYFSIARVSSVSVKANIPNPLTVYVSGPIDTSMILDTTNIFTFKNLKYGIYKIYAKTNLEEILTDTVIINLPNDTLPINLSAKCPLISVTPQKFIFEPEAKLPVINIFNTGSQKLNYVITTKALRPKILINEIYCGDDKTIANGIELINCGDEIKLSGYTLTLSYFNVSSKKENKHTFTFPNGFVIKAGKTCIIQEKNENLNDSVIYIDTALTWNNQSDLFLSVTLYDSTQIHIDHFASKSFNGISKGISWNGEGVELKNPIVYRMSTIDSDMGSDWKTSSNASVNSINPGQVIGSNVKARIFPAINSGEVSGGDSTTIPITVDTSYIGETTYSDTIMIYHDSPNFQSPIKIPFTLSKKILAAGKIIFRNASLFMNPVMAKNGIIVNYTLPEKSNMDLSIYNIQGKRVFQMGNNLMLPGSYSLSLNERGIHMSSGMYVIHLKANNNSIIRNFNYVR